MSTSASDSQQQLFNLNTVNSTTGSQFGPVMTNNSSHMNIINGGANKNINITKNNNNAYTNAYSNE